MSNQPASVSEMWPSRYIKAEDMQGKTFELTIDRVAFERMHQFDGSEAIKAVVYFRGAQKGLVVNKTQAMSIADITGSEKFSDWPGHKVRMWAGKAKNGKPTVVVGAPAKVDMV